MKKFLVITLVLLLSLELNIIAQNSFKTDFEIISIPGELVYSGFEYNMQGNSIWANGYCAVVGDSVYYTKVLHPDENSDAYYCKMYIACLNDVFVFDQSVITFDDPILNRQVYLFTMSGKAENSKRIKAVKCREYSTNHLQIKKPEAEYSLLFSFTNINQAEDFHKRLTLLAGTKEQKE